MISKIHTTLFWIILFVPLSCLASPRCEPWIAKAVSVQGNVDVQYYESKTWHKFQVDEPLCYGDKIRTDKWARAALILNNDSLVSVDQNTTLNLQTQNEQKPGWLMQLFNGSVFIRSRESRKLKIETPFINAVHEGTEFLVTVKTDRTEISVFDGIVSGNSPNGNVKIAKNEHGIAQKNYAPVVQNLTIKPQDAVQWSLYYPPLIDSPKAAQAEKLQPAYSEYLHGNIDGALALLKNEPANAQQLKLKIAIFLRIGRLDEATSMIEQLAANDPSSALAFRAIIAVTKNQADAALKFADQAVALNSQSAIALIAQSYAYQSIFKISDALKSVQKATEMVQDNALLWSRLAQLELANGNHSAALTAARKAEQLNPDLAGIQVLFGFANLASNNAKVSKQAFKKAITLDSSDPLARLGLGLAEIDQGDLEQGTRELETAVNLNANSAVIRSYLGKAYYEQKNQVYAEKEFELAKAADLNDPTPWLYDAILKQSTNRPVQALHDMQTAIKLNDFRGIYRSSLLLDEDRASRAVSLSRIYNNLGFDQVAINTSTSSLSNDQSNYSAHRFLFDSYAQRPRHEAARISELLQAQLLQPININPVQPETVETNLNIQSGMSPSTIGFNEFTALFDRNKDQFIGSGIIGNHNTYADQAVVAGHHDGFSYSLGQFHYQNDNFPENFALRHNLYNVFTQAALTENLNIQFEYRHRETRKGDLSLSLFPEQTYTDVLASKQDTPRFGLHFEPNSHSDLIFSYTYADKNENYTLNNKQDGKLVDASGLKSTGNDFQGQYLYRTARVNSTIGTSYFNIDNVLNTTETKTDFTSRWFDSYLYTHTELPKNLKWTLGVSYIAYSETKNENSNKLLDLSRINPKIGLEWAVFDKLKLRMAYFETIKRTLLFEQAIEPTQVARFNQIFDDANGTLSKNKAIGLDLEFSESLYGGIELFKRDLVLPHVFAQRPEDQKEDQYRAYLYWTPLSNWTLSAKYSYEQFRRWPASRNGEIIEAGSPTQLFTQTIPLNVRYFNPNGIFASGTMTYVSQTVAFVKDVGIDVTASKPDFTVFDLSLGYRFPKRWGIVSVDFKNIFDTDLQYQDNSLLGNGYKQPLYSPDRSIFGKVLVTF